MNQQFSSVPPVDILWDLLGPMEREKVIIDDREFFLDHPTDTERLLDHPAVHSAYARDDYIPYWTDLWPAARMLAKVIRRHTWTPGTDALEIGCGLGLPGIVALSVGLRVIFSDYDACAVHRGGPECQTQWLQRFSLHAHRLALSSRGPARSRSCWPPILCMSSAILPRLPLSSRRFSVPAACACSPIKTGYRPRLVKQALRDVGLQFSSELVRAGEPGGRRLRGTLYRITNDLC